MKRLSFGAVLVATFALCSASVTLASGGSNSQNAGAPDPKYCVKVVPKGQDSYSVANECPFGITVKLKTMKLSPEKTAVGSHAIGANKAIEAMSYHDQTPIVVSVKKL